MGTTLAWDDPQLTRGYGLVRAQLQAGRANDLLGVAHAAEHGEKVPYVLYHPGFTRSGDASARPVEESVAAVHDFIDDPPKAPLTAVDRGRRLPLTLRTLDAGDAARLAAITAGIRA
ncbi:hypothetical protein [Herbidospora daliensis]|uniref:hypothetical protein n=1 Tax=Herbidospora daliensis TaxID=295585 RepID=UPI0018DE9D04|nr:hypothetical protein [Herbidospora daliensis]